MGRSSLGARSTARSPSTGRARRSSGAPSWGCSPLAPNETFRVKPDLVLSDSELYALPPAVTAPDDGVADKVKVGTGLTTSVTLTVRLKDPAVPVTVSG